MYLDMSQNTRERRLIGAVLQESAPAEVSEALSADEMEVLQWISSQWRLSDYGDSSAFEADDPKLVMKAARAMKKLPLRISISTDDRTLKKHLGKLY
jgi:hypothetical protein